ncbi:MAG TPA: SOS response-associated peptidase [Pseudolabrys sp.]|nr:SOS response-associated peptidase [Pseudolabrys sp.]
MCGRYTVTSAPEAIRALFRYDERPNFPPRFNIAPTQPIAVVRLHEGKRQFALMRWGLLPSWVKDPKTFSLLINARADTVCDKPAFRAAMKRRRCLIPADGFYEWKPEGGRKQPFYIRAKSGEPLAFAGLWETWTGPNGEELDTAAIITTDANRGLNHIHDRMPAIVPPEAFDLWLNTNEVDARTAEALLMPARDDLLEAYPVSTAVNRTANDNAKLIEPFAPADAEAPAMPPTSKPAPKSAAKPAEPRARAKRAKEDGGQGALF